MLIVFISPPIAEKRLVCYTDRLRRGNRRRPLWRSRPRRELAVKRFSVAQLLDVVQTAGDAFVAVRVKGVEVHACLRVYAAVDLRADGDGLRLLLIVHDAGRRDTVGVDKVAVSIGFVVGAFRIAVAERSFKYRQSRYGLAVAFLFQLTIAIGVNCLNCCLDSVEGAFVGLGDDKRDRVFRHPSVDGLRFSEVGVKESAPDCDDLRGVNCVFCVSCHDSFLLIFVVVVEVVCRRMDC